MLDDKTMEIIRDLIGEQDQRLLQLKREHEQGNPTHTVEVFNNFIQCKQCDYHVHVSGLSVVQHTATRVISVSKLVLHQNGS